MSDLRKTGEVRVKGREMLSANLTLGPGKFLQILKSQVSLFANDGSFNQVSKSLFS